MCISLLTTGLLVLTLCSKDNQAESTTFPRDTPTAVLANNGTQATPEIELQMHPPAEQAIPSAEAKSTAEPKDHAATASLLTISRRGNRPLAEEGPRGTGGLYAKFQTNQGDIVVEFYSKSSPLTVANFVGLATSDQAWKDPHSGQMVKLGTPLYQNVIFHRVIPDFMLQGGDTLSQGIALAGQKVQR